jgi:hypothetical protein
MLPLGGPVPRQELFQPVDGVISDAGEHIGQPSLRIDVVEFRRLCRPPNYAGRTRFPRDSQ